MPVLPIAQRLAQLRDVVGEVGFLNYGVGPDHSHQLIFFQQTSVTLDQREQQVEDFGLKRDDLAVAQQEVFRRIQAERAEFVDVLCLQAHSRSMISPRIPHEISESFLWVFRRFCRRVGRNVRSEMSRK
jgi:hypothetical protein